VRSGRDIVSPLARCDDQESLILVSGLLVSKIAILACMSGEQKTNLLYNPLMTRCRVSFIDPDGIPHTVEVQADSLYEAVAMAVAEFRADSMSDVPGPMTEFSVAIHRPAVEHRIRLGQVTKWAEGSTTEGPAGMTRRQRVKSLLNKR
jgi:hypothetical protein